MRARLAALALALALAGCIPAPRPPLMAPARPPAQALAPPPPAADWRDLPLTPGTWRYDRDARGTVASFGEAGRAPLLLVRCDLPTRRVILSLPGTAAGVMTVTTSYATASWAATAEPGGRIAVALDARDPFLDKIAFSRGRFGLAMPGAPLLIVPAWAEPARAIQDCRS